MQLFCPICDSSRSSLLYSLPFPFARCPQCGLLFRVDHGQIKDPNIAYRTEDSASRPAQLLEEEPARRAYTRSRAKWINRHASPQGPLLEIGAGTGSLLVHLRHMGWDVEGIEPSPMLHTHAVNQLEGVSVHRCELDKAGDLLSLKPYRAIVSIDVIEHIPAPFMLTRRAFDWLQPGGYLFLQTPNVESLRHRVQGCRWEQLAPGEHHILHSSKSLRAVIEKAGLVVEGIQTLSGSADDNPLRHLLMQAGGACLNLVGLGNALWAVARKRLH